MCPVQHVTTCDMLCSSAARDSRTYQPSNCIKQRLEPQDLFKEPKGSKFSHVGYLSHSGSLKSLQLIAERRSTTSSRRGVRATEEENPTQTTEQAENPHRYACLPPSQCQRPVSPDPRQRLLHVSLTDHALWGTDQLHYFGSLVKGGRLGTVLAALHLLRW